jgi:Glycogen debranching enzyme
MLKYNEWLITNKKGSYASSSSVFANLRTYHGLCVKRDQNYEGKVLLSKLYEEFEIDGKSYSIDTNYYLDAIYPEGFKHLIDFNQDQFPWFEFNVAGSLITKSLVMDPDKDWLVIRYDFIGRLPDKIYLHPLFAFRSYHLALRKREMNVETFNQKTDTALGQGMILLIFMSKVTL